MTPRRQDAKTTLAATLMCLGVLASWRPLSAQVGHDPATSPYRDIQRGVGPVFFAGHLSGDRGRGDAGPGNALGIGARYELPLGRATVAQLTVAYLKGDRFIRNPFVSDTAATRRTGPVDTDLLFTEFALQLRLTGGKTWHGLAPYFGGGIGLAFDTHSPGDTTDSGYQFGTKLTFSGATGVRWHVARKMTVHLDGRMVFWRLKYPLSFHSLGPDGSRVVSIAQPLTEWTSHPWVSLGIGWIF
jgi:hypothetical protein